MWKVLVFCLFLRFYAINDIHKLLIFPPWIYVHNSILRICVFLCIQSFLYKSIINRLIAALNISTIGRDSFLKMAFNVKQGINQIEDKLVIYEPIKDDVKQM